MRSNADDVVVTRTFNRDDGEVLLLLQKPRPDSSPLDAEPTDPPWRCNYTIVFPDGEIKHDYSMGVDGMQSMLLALAGARHRLRYVANGTPEMRPKVQFLSEDDLGLSIPQFD